MSHQKMSFAMSDARRWKGLSSVVAFKSTLLHVRFGAVAGMICASKQLFTMSLLLYIQAVKYRPERRNIYHPKGPNNLDTRLGS